MLGEAMAITKINKEKWESAQNQELKLWLSIRNGLEDWNSWWATQFEKYRNSEFIKMTTKGQINIGSVFGDMLVEYSSRPNICNIVEIGTWNGRGSTSCVVEGLKKSNKEKHFISIEACLSQFQSAIKLYNDDWIKIFHGRILEINEITFDFSLYSLVILPEVSLNSSSSKLFAHFSIGHLDCSS